MKIGYKFQCSTCMKLIGKFDHLHSDGLVVEVEVAGEGRLQVSIYDLFILWQNPKFDHLH